MGPFFFNRQTVFFFRASARKTKTKIPHMEPGRYNGRQRLWLFLLPVGRPRPICSRARVYRAMGNAPYRRRHENRVGGGVLPNNPPWLLVRKKLSSWALPAMASTAAYAIRGCSAQRRALTGPWATPPTASLGWQCRQMCLSAAPVK